MFQGLSDTIQYEVASGDTLSKIADRFGTTWEQIAEDNSIDDPNIIHPGDVLDINASGEVEQSSSPIRVPTVAQTKSPIASMGMSKWFLYGGVAILAGAIFMIVKNKNKETGVIQKVKKTIKKYHKKG